jgi:phytoene desaturase
VSHHWSRVHVTVVERDELLGGRAGILHRDGFTFDTLRTVLTMPDLIADAVRAASRNPRADLKELLPMSARSGVPGPFRRRRHDQRALRPGGHVGRIAQPYGSVDAAAFDMYADWLGRLYSIEVPNFTDQNYDSPLGRLFSSSRSCRDSTARRLRTARCRGAVAVRDPRSSGYSVFRRCTPGCRPVRLLASTR